MIPQAMIFRLENLERGTWPAKQQISRGRAACSIFVLMLLTLGSAKTVTAQNDVMGELQFEGKTKVERDSGVWIDGNYVGYLKELNGSKKIMLLPGEHQVTVKQSGYIDFVQKVVVEPGEKRLVVVSLHLAPSATAPEVTATLKLKIKPARAAVFLDGKFVGHAGDFGGAFKSMKISPGKHRVRVELPAYRTFETEVNLLANQESEIKTELVKGSIEQNTPLIKKPDDKPQQQKQ
jgi:PEGA domain-containing protein